jgi:hypothetical protein
MVQFPHIFTAISCSQSWILRRRGSHAMATLQIEQLIGREDAKRRLDLGMVREALVMLFFVYSIYKSLTCWKHDDSYLIYSS